MQPALHIESLRFTYPSSGFSLSLPALTLQPGDQLLLSAPSGQGKSTLLALVAGLLDPTSGSVIIDNQNIHALSGANRDRFRGSHIGMIFQTFNLLRGFSAAENVIAALLFSNSPPSDRAARAASLLTSLGITDHHHDVATLSAGQQQRVAIARAVACKPKLVLADEPTSSLDPENAIAAMDLIQHTCRAHNAALLCVSHDPAIWARFDRKQSLLSLPAAQLAAAKP